MIKRVLIACFLILAVSCEELTEGLTPRDNILGTWRCVEKDARNLSETFEVEIEAQIANSNGVQIYNFNNLGISVNANVTETSVTISNQKVDGFTVSGSGTINAGADRINLSYSVDDGSGVKENYTATLTKL